MTSYVVSPYVQIRTVCTEKHVMGPQWVTVGYPNLSTGCQRYIRSHRSKTLCMELEGEWYNLILWQGLLSLKNSASNRDRWEMISINYGLISAVHWTPVKWKAAEMSQQCFVANVINDLSGTPSMLACTRAANLFCPCPLISGMI